MLNGVKWYKLPFDPKAWFHVQGTHKCLVRAIKLIRRHNMIKRNPSPKQLTTLWANRAQKSTTIQTTGQRHTITWGIDKKALRQDTRRAS